MLSQTPRLFPDDANCTLVMSSLFDCFLQKSYSSHEKVLPYQFQEKKTGLKAQMITIPDVCCDVCVM